MNQGHMRERKRGLLGGDCIMHIFCGIDFPIERESEIGVIIRICTKATKKIRKCELIYRDKLNASYY